MKHSKLINNRPCAGFLFGEHLKKAIYANSNRLRIVQRRILFVVAGAWSADFFFNPSADIALALNLSILALLIVCVVLQIALMRSS